MIWDTAERLVNRSTLIENSEDAKKIMRAPSKHKSLHRLKSMDGQVHEILNCYEIFKGRMYSIMRRMKPLLRFLEGTVKNCR